MTDFYTAYTVGNPESYESYLDEEPEPMKQKGGVVFLTFEDAQECVKDGFLPSEWFDDGIVRPGKVYGLVCDLETDVAESDLGFYLKRATKLLRIRYT